MIESNKYLVTKNLDSISSELYKILNPNCKFHIKGHRFNPNKVASYERLHPTRSKEFHAESSVFYKSVLLLRKQYNLYPENGILTNNLGNLAIADLSLIFPNDTLSRKLFSFSCEDEFKKQNPNLSRFEYNSNQNTLVMERDIKSLEIFRSLRGSLKLDFEHKQNTFDRSWDTEYKLLEYIFRLIQSHVNFADFDKVRGGVVIISERSICESCFNVIVEFKKIFPSIDCTIKSCYGDEYCRYEEDNIVFVPKINFDQPKNLLN